MYLFRMTDMTPRLLPARQDHRRPFDRVGLACLAWCGAFLCLTALITFVGR